MELGSILEESLLISIFNICVSKNCLCTMSTVTSLPLVHHFIFFLIPFSLPLLNLGSPISRHEHVVDRIGRKEWRETEEE